MRKTRLLKHFLLLFALIAGSMSVWAEDTPITFNLSGTNGVAVESVSSGDVTITFAKGTNTSNAPTWYDNGSALRFYSGNTITFASSGAKITKVILTNTESQLVGGTNGANFPSGGTYSVSNGVETWTASTALQSFTVNITNKPRLTKIEVYLEAGTPKTPIATIGDISLSEIEIGEGTIPLAGLLAYITFAEGKTVEDCVPTISSDDTSVLEISISGTNLAYNAKKAGQATLTLTLTPTPTNTENYTAVSKQLTVTVVDPNAEEEVWELTDLANLTESDVFVIVGNNGSNYAMSNNGGTTNAPSAVAVTVSDGKLTGTIADNIKWNISDNATDGYTFYPDGSTTTWLYCTNSNNGVRVGTGDAKHFSLSSGGYLTTTETTDQRYLGIYQSQDWRCYKKETESNIKDQTFAFYKKVTGDVTVPSITASNVEIEYDATGGAISYTINNPVDGGTVSAAINEGDWITLGQGTTSPISFTCSANETTTARTATVTLTYTYATDKTVTKDVTVTQAAAPVVYSTIPALFDAATSTETNVNVTFGGWVVSGVNGSTAYVTDNEGNGFIIYKSSHGFNVNDKLSGTVTGTPLKLYKGAAEFTNLTASTTGLTVTNDGVITVVTDKTIADLGGVNTGAVFTLSNLTYDGTNLSDGTNNTIQPYNTLYAGTFEANKTYNVTGVYLQYDSKKEILPRSADDIVEVVSTEPQIVVEATTINLAYNATSGEIPFTIVNPVENASFGAGTFDTPWITNVNAVKIDATHYKVTFTTEANTGEERSATITINYNGVTKDVTVTQAAYVAPADGYYVKVTSTDDLTDGQYLVVYEEGSVAFDGGLTTLDAVGNTIEVVIDDDEIAATSATRAAEFTIDVTAGTLQSASGKYIGVSTNSNGLKTSDDAGTYTNAFSIDDNENAVIAAVFEESSMTLRFNSASNQNRFRYYSSGQKDIQLYKYIPEYETVETAHEYITFCSTKALDFSQVEGLDAYIVTKVNTSSVSTTKVETAVPAGTGLVLKKTVNATSFEVPVVAEATALEGNLLTGVTEPTLIGNTTATDYILYDGTFYPASQGTLPAGKAYLRVDNTNAPELGLDFSGETTGIVNVNRETITNNQYYTLDGRHVENPTNGIYIINGRKVVIK